MRLDRQRAWVRRFVSELARVELIDRSLALGAQMLLAIIPLLMVVGAFLPQDWGSDLLAQVRDTIGVDDDRSRCEMRPSTTRGCSPRSGSLAS